MAPVRRFLFLFLFVLIRAVPAWPQIQAEDAASYIGLSIERLIDRFGVPRSVYAVRGSAEWQDDVVFVYDSMDCYVFKDRVWQVGLKSWKKIKTGDSKPAVVLELGDTAMDEGSRIRLPLPGTGWPLELQVNMDSSGFVASIFVSRSDF
jgi:hypothetical protein